MMIALLMVLLAGGQQAPSTPVPAGEAKQRCRVEPVLGSLARRIRTCHTAAEWRAIDDAGSKTGGDMIERGQQTCGGCARGG